VWGIPFLLEIDGRWAAHLPSNEGYNMLPISIGKIDGRCGSHHIVHIESLLQHSKKGNSTRLASIGISNSFD
jgi:hypothetical protein